MFHKPPYRPFDPSLSDDIVMQGRGGTLAVEREEGQGAAFVVRLPAMPVPVP